MQLDETTSHRWAKWLAKVKDDLQATARFWIRRRARRGPMKLDENVWRRWASSITKVEEDVQSTVNDRAAFQGFSDVVRENESWISAHNGMYFCHFVARAYVAMVALGIRRHVKWRDDSISLLRILSQLKECAPQLTFDFYLQQFPRDPEYVPWQEPTFELVSEDGSVASEKRIAADIERLQLLTGQVEALVDRALAHLDRKGFQGQVTFDDLDKAVVGLDDIATKYICLLTGRGYPGSLEATVQFDWKRIFSVPWRQPSGLLV